MKPYLAIKKISDKDIRYTDENSMLHRDDGPAIEYIAGPCIGHKIYYSHGIIHRADGPAIEWYNGNKEWILNGKRHREDGPATIFSNGNKQYWFDDKEYEFEDWQQIVKLKAFL